MISMRHSAAASVSTETFRGPVETISFTEVNAYHCAHLRLPSDPESRLKLAQDHRPQNLRPGDIATLIRCEKHHSISDLNGPAKPAERDRASYHLAPLLTRFARREQIRQAGRVDGTRADRVDSNPAILEIRGPRSRERADGRLRGAVNTIRGKAFAANDRGTEDDRCTFGHQRKRLLCCEQHS